MSIRDAIWVVGIFIALGATWGMTSQRVSAMEKDSVKEAREARTVIKDLQKRVNTLSDIVKESKKYIK